MIFLITSSLLGSINFIATAVQLRADGLSWFRLPFFCWAQFVTAFLLLLVTFIVWRGGGRWTGTGWRWPLGIVGFAIPALGLSLYLHYAYSINLDGMFDDAGEPTRVFRYLPIYTLVAGGIGFAIGWIVGRNV